MKRLTFFSVILFTLSCTFVFAQKDESKDYAKIKEEL